MYERVFGRVFTSPTEYRMQLQYMWYSGGIFVLVMMLMMKSHYRAHLRYGLVVFEDWSQLATGSIVVVVEVLDDPTIKDGNGGGGS